MRSILWVLASLLLVLGLVAIHLVLPEPEGVGGSVHPEYSTMRQGVANAEGRTQGLGWGWALGAAMICVFCALVHFGGARGQNRRSLTVLLWIALTLHLAVWTWMVLEYQAYAGGAVEARILGLPRVTAILLFAFWPASLVYTTLFVTGFSRWVLTDEERRRFHELVARQRSGST